MPDFEQLKNAGDKSLGYDVINVENDGDDNAVEQKKRKTDTEDTEENDDDDDDDDDIAYADDILDDDDVILMEQKKPLPRPDRKDDVGRMIYCLLLLNISSNQVIIVDSEEVEREYEKFKVDRRLLHLDDKLVNEEMNNLYPVLQLIHLY